MADRFLAPMHCRWCLIVQGLMQALLVVKHKVLLEATDGFWHTLIIFDVHLFIFHTAPQAFHKNVVQGTPTPIPTDVNACAVQATRKLCTRELHPLIAIEDLRLCYS